MKRLLLLLLLIPMFTVSALAVDEDIPVDESVIEAPEVTPVEETPEAAPSYEVPSDEVEVNPSLGTSLYDTYLTYDTFATYELDEYTAHQSEDSSDLASVITRLFGEYTPRTQTVTEHLSDGSVSTSQQIVPGVAGMDFAWLAAASLFALALFCLFKIIGGLMKL